MKTKIPKDFIAIIGRGTKGSLLQDKISLFISKEIINNGFGICGGNISGPLGRVFEILKRKNGITRLVTADNMFSYERHNCDILEVVNCQTEKHQLISKISIGAIVLSNEKGIEKIINQFLVQKKPVIAIKQLMSQSALPQQVIIETNYKKVLSKILNIKLAS